MLLTSDYPPAHGGIQRYADRLSRALYELNAPVAVVAPKMLHDAEHDREVPFPVFRYDQQGRVGVVTAMASNARKALDTIGCDHVISAVWNPAAIAARLLGATRRLRLDVLAHGSEIARQDTPVRRAALWSVLAGTSVFANSHFTARLLRQHGVRDVRVVPCGVDFTPETMRNPAAIPTILSVGRLIRRKGYDALIKSLPGLARSLGDVRLVIVGDGPDRVYLEALAAQCRVTDKVEFLGAVDDEEVGRRFSEAWCFAMPNRRVAQDVEGFGIVFLEAAMYDLPTVGGRGSGAEDAIEDGVTGYLVDGSDVVDVMTALEKLLANPKRAELMGRNGRERALRFTWTGVAQQFLA